MQRKLITWLLVLVMLIGVLPFGSLAAGFQDVKSGAYYYDAVQWAVKEGITNGTSATAFSPDATCTRAQIVTFLWRAKGEPEPSSAKNPFQDVKSDAYYYKAVIWAVEQGITQGTGKTSFSPSQGCTRGQVATFLWRCAGSEKSAAQNPFQDVSAGAYYHDAVLWAVEHEITKGTGATTFSPNATCTRAQIVTFLFRAQSTIMTVPLSELDADERFLAAEEQETVLFTVKAGRSEESVLLYRQGDKTPLTMHDDGKNGDLKANDGLYSVQVTENQPAGASVEFYAKRGEETTDRLTIYFFAKPTEESAKEAEKQKNDVISHCAAIEKKHLDQTYHVPFEDIAATMKEIENYLTQAQKDGKVLLFDVNYSSAYIKFPSGLGMVYELSLFGVNAGGDKVSLSLSSYQPSFDLIDSNWTGRLEGVSSRLDNVSFGKGKRYEDAKVTREVVQSISSNQVVAWNGHGGYGSLIKSYLFIGEHFDWEKWKYDLLYWNDCLHDRIVGRDVEVFKDDDAAAAEKKKSVLAITSKFISKYCGDMSNDLILLASCHSGQDPKLANAFLNKGAYAVLGFSDAVNTGYCMEFSMKTLEFMSAIDPDTQNYYTLAKAVEKAKEHCGKNDQEYVNAEYDDPWTTRKAEPVLFGEKTDKYRLSTTYKQEFCLTDPESTFVTNATIQLSHKGVTFTAKLITDDYGFHTYEVRVPKGKCTLRITAEGFRDVEEELEITGADSWDYQLDRDGDYHDLYADIVREREGTWGLGLVQDYRWQNSKQMIGVSAVRVLDMDGDGIDELILAYMPNALTDAHAPTCEIWTFDGKKPVQLWNKSVVSLGQDIAYSLTLAKVDGVWMYVYGANGGYYAPYFEYDLYALKNGRLVKAHTATIQNFDTSNPKFLIDGNAVSSDTYRKTGESWYQTTIQHYFLVSQSEGDQLIAETKKERAKLGISVDAEALKLVNDRIKAAGDFLYGHFFTMSLTDKNDVIKTDQYPYQYYRVKVADSLEAFRAYARKFYSVNAVDSLIQRTQYCWLEQNGKLYVGPFGSGDAAIVSAEADVYQTSDTQYEVHFLDNSEYGTKSTCSNRLILENGNWVWEKLDWSHFMPFSVTAY